jgi:DNA-binding ferritin-like protein
MDRNACQCESPGSYEEGLEVIWHTPTEYDMERHGPPYLPEKGVRLSSVQKQEVRAFVKQAKVDVKATVGQVLASEPGLTPWTVLMAYLQALAMVHQSHHWNTNGGDFYGDHLLFERLYNESTGFIDDVAERAVGKQMPPMIDVLLQARQIGAIIKGLQNKCFEAGYVELSLQGELICLGIIEAVKAKLEELGQLSSGDSNLIEGIADKHESFVYLLRQRFSGTPESKPHEVPDASSLFSTPEDYTYER